MNYRKRFTFRQSGAGLGFAVAVLVALFLGRTADTVRAQNQAAEKVIYNFAPATGFDAMGLTGDSAGNLYAATNNGGDDRSCSLGCGSLLKLSMPYGRPTTLYSFRNSGFDGQGTSPVGLTRDANGSLYAPMGYGGRNQLGWVFKFVPSGSAGSLYSFEGGNDGSLPVSGVTLDPAGNLYGTAESGGGIGCGGQGCGVVYKLTRSGVETVLYRFTGGADGYRPEASPILDAAGNIYGTARYGGDLACPIFSGDGCGTVWKLDTSGNFSVLYTFTGGTDGAFPKAGLVMDASANLYGAALYGGNTSCNEGLGCGDVFKIDSSGNFGVLYAFAGGSGDGLLPAATPFSDTSGNLYGTTLEGGDQSCPGGCGIVFKLDASGNETVLHVFTGGTGDGAGPALAPLITDGKGSLYGITSAGGLANSGVIFQVRMQ